MKGQGPQKAKVAVAMSGGVDSGVVAALLVKEGYQVTGIHLHFWVEKQSCQKAGKNLFENKCCSTESLEAARQTAHLLKIPFYVLDFEEIFKKKVVDYFLAEFAKGKTPNPCVRCNQFIKFGKLLDYILKCGFDFLATGHYAQISLSGAGRRHNNFYRLLAARDLTKDQSYFLYSLSQKRLAHLLFPIGDFTKEEVRKMAQKWKLPVAQRPESQEICFFPETDYRPFLRRQIPGKIISGEMVDTSGLVIGEHNGLPLYTIGQRHGFRVRPHLRGVHSATSEVLRSDSSEVLLAIGAPRIPFFNGPWYVVAKDIENNRLVVGWGKECEKKRFQVTDVNWIKPKFLEARDLRVLVRIRHLGQLYPCQLITHHSKLITVILEEPAWGVAPGQVAVFYQEDEVLGGGIITQK